MSRQSEPFQIGGISIKPGQEAKVELPISLLSNGLSMTLPVRVIHGRDPGPVLFVSAAVHGDEIVGVEIIRRLSKRPALKRLAGTLLLVPVVNGYGFLARSRYLPDRRDLNRCFPGDDSGSLASRLADVFLTQVVARSDLGIDIHSAAIHRSNLPQIRIAPKDDRMRELANAFGAPAILTSNLRQGSLRQAAADLGVPVLLFEGGEGLRFDETVVRAGLAGTMRVMKHAGMIRAGSVGAAPAPSFFSPKSYWLRAPEGGLLRLAADLGDNVQAGQKLGTISDLFGDTEIDILATHDGVIVGRATLPVVNEGDAVLHIARAGLAEPATDKIGTIVEHLDQADMFYEDEII